MSSPSDPQSPAEPVTPTPSSTQEIPVVQPAGATAVQNGSTPQLPPHPGATTPPPVAMEEPQPTGPVDFVPGLPSTPPVPPPTAAPPPPVEPVAVEEPVAASGPVWPETLESDAVPARESRRRRVRLPGDRTAVLGPGLAVLALVLLELGLTMDFGTESYWSAVPLWSAFATLCAVLGVLALGAAAAPGGRLRTGVLWRVAAGGLVGLAVFWLLVVLPVVASDRGFLLTAAVGALGAALWTSAGRKA